ncbi:hypothetical protein [Roseibium sp.]|uniref:hypothetical protein n=1 Tax=Roseibium sp. TaxID=1936156 RepID=UPI003A986EF7
MKAVSELRRAFAERADGVSPAGMPFVGLFGDGIPYPLVQAAGAFGIDVKAPPLADSVDGPKVAIIDEVAESFLDDFTARFLHRFAAGAFDHFAMIIFARDDVAGLAAYQYASELRRQKLVTDTGPVLHLWNLLHTDSAAAHRFNMRELDRLGDALAGLSLTWDEKRLSRILALEVDRRAALDRLTCCGADQFIFRAAGRWLAPEEHTAALDAVGDGSAVAGERRIGLVGNASDTPCLREICSEFGALAADLQPFGDIWSYHTDGVDDAESLVRAIATNPLHIRTSPADRFGSALLDRLKGCDVVISTVDRNDDSFGWEVPCLRQNVTKRGAQFIDLGFMPFRPSDSWMSATRKLLAETIQ